MSDEPRDDGRATDFAIEARGLEKSFGAVRAVRALDLEIARGECWALFGPNGAGKSTLLAMLSSGLRPSKGELRLFGGPASDPSVRRRVGVVGHGSFLQAELTARENLEFFARLYGVPQGSRRARELLERVELAEWADRPVRTFSRGMEQRLAIARAILHEPDLLLLDEPWSGLDPVAARILDGLLAGIHEAGTAILVTTHDLHRGLSLADRCGVLARGRLAWRSDGAKPTPAAMEEIYHRALGGGG